MSASSAPPNLKARLTKDDLLASGFDIPALFYVLVHSLGGLFWKGSIIAPIVLSECALLG